MFRKVLSLIALLFILTSNVFAEAAIIYAPTKAPEPVRIIDNRIINEEYINDKGNQIAYASGETTYYTDASQIDYNTVITRLYEDNNGNFYILNASKQPVKNAWRRVFNNNHEYWVFCGNNGKIIKSNNGRIKRCSIDGNTFVFNEYGEMLTGYFNDEGEVWNERNYSDPFELLNGNNYLYYAGNNGVLHTGWLQYLDNTDKYEWKNNIWLYFDPSNYRSLRSKSENKYKLYKIGYKQFAFDSNGVMLTGMDAMRYDLDDGQSIKYFNSDGSVVTNGFVELNWDDEIVEEKFSDYDNYEDISIYLSRSGKLYKNMVKKINSNYYGFDENGVVLKNCLGIFNSGRYVDTVSIEDTDGRKFIIENTYINKAGDKNTYNQGDNIYYFDYYGKRQNSGRLEFEDEQYIYNASNSGAYESNKNGMYYTHGLVMKPFDSKYGIYIMNPDKTTYSSNELYGNSNAFVVNNSGRKLTHGAYKDDNDDYWVVSTSGNLLGVYRCKIKTNPNKYYSVNYDGKETWIPFGEKDRNGRTEKDFLVRLTNEVATNFWIKNY